MYKIGVYIPRDSAETVKEAMFAAGAGRIGNYRRCAWQSLGEGQFEAMPGSDPHVGELGQLHREAELRVEMVCEDAVIREVIAALRAAHPYETPAFDVLRLESF